MHWQASAGIAGGQRPARWSARPQTDYWRTTHAQLWEAIPPVRVNAAGLAASFVGPAGTGEVWDVQLVQVQTTSLLTRAGVSAQIYRGVGGVTIDLLFISQSGGFDNIGVTGRPISAGEQIIVIWEGAFPGDMAWATLQGTKTVLEAMPGGSQA